MNTTYLLPCSCGQKIHVEPRQAGETVKCACGQDAAVPSLLQMAKLEQAEVQQIAAAPTWGLSQRLLVVGIVVLVVAAFMGLYAILTAPVSPTAAITPEVVHRQVERFSAARSLWEFWQMEKDGLDRGIRKADDAYKQALAIHHLWLGVTAIVAGLGIALILVGVKTRQGSRGEQARDAVSPTRPTVTKP